MNTPKLITTAAGLALIAGSVGFTPAFASDSDDDTSNKERVVSVVQDKKGDVVFADGAAPAPTEHKGKGKGKGKGGDKNRAPVTAVDVEQLKAVSDRVEQTLSFRVKTGKGDFTQLDGVYSVGARVTAGENSWYVLADEAGAVSLTAADGTAVDCSEATVEVRKDRWTFTVPTACFGEVTEVTASGVAQLVNETDGTVVASDSTRETKPLDTTVYVEVDDDTDDEVEDDDDTTVDDGTGDDDTETPVDPAM